MASIRSTIDLVITGATRGLSAAAAEARATAERVADAEDRVSDARRRSAEAESRVADVESRLAGARAQHTASLNQIGVAETNLERVRARNQGATSRLGQAEAELARLRANGGSAQEIEAAERRVTEVRQQSDRAAADLQRAEAQLERARGNAANRASQVAALEERLAQARGRAFRASEDLARQEERLRLIQRRGTDDLNRQRDGILGIVDAFRNLGQAFSGADGASTSLLAKLGALHNLVTSIGGPIVQAVVGIAEFVAVLAAAGEIIGVLGGLIGQVLGGAVPVLVALAAAAGTVALGMDGIKKAAEVMAPAFNKLKAAVSDTFQRELTPAFRELAGIIPRLTADFQDVARAVSFIISDFAKFAASKRGFEDLQAILAGTAALLTGVRSGIADFIRGILSAAAAAQPAMEALGVAIGSVFSRIGEVFERLGNNGTIAAAIVNLASTFRGLGDVIGAVIELLIRMGAALDIGGALTSLSDIIRSSIPAFEHLAKVAGDLLVAAFETIGPAIQRFIGNGIGPATSAMDTFAAFVRETVFPAIRDFIDWLAGPGINAAVAFAAGLTASITDAASGVLTVVSGMLATFRQLFVFLAVQTGDQKFLAMAEGAEKARLGVDKLNTTVQGLHDKSVNVLAKTQGEDAVKALSTAIFGVVDKLVTTTSNVPGGPTLGTLGNQILKGAIDLVPDKTVTTQGNVPGGPTLGTLGNQLLKGAVDLVPSKTVTTTGNVPSGPTLGTLGNQVLKGAIDQVNSKTVQVVANVSGESAVRSLGSAIGGLVSKTVNVVTNFITNGIPRFAEGGWAPGGTPILVGERGPELIVLPRGGGFVNTAAQTRGILSNASVTGATTNGAVAGGGPMVIENHIEIGGEVVRVVRTEITDQERRTNRRVLAGSGNTF